MATAPAPVKNVKNDNPAVKQSLVPPDEKFWQRYSPHHELPLSSIGSFALHVLGFGLLALMALLGTYLFNNSNRSLPVEAVRLLSGGGGDRHGTGDTGKGGGALVEEGAQDNNPAENVLPENTDTPKKINVDTPPKINPTFDSASNRYIQERNTESAKAFANLGKASSKIRIGDGKRSYGGGGAGEGGGSGDGKGGGIGNRTGDGQDSLTQREKRMLRWSMLFNTSSGENYVAQLNGLGAILAIPVKEEGEPEFEIVRDLKSRPAKLLKEDISKIQRIYWIDENPQSVRDVMRVLGLKLSPSRFIAFMPEELEKQLFDLEAKYLEKHYRGKNEDNIVETKFKINVKGGKYEPEVTNMRVK